MKRTAAEEAQYPWNARQAFSSYSSSPESRQAAASERGPASTAANSGKSSAMARRARVTLNPPIGCPASTSWTAFDAPPRPTYTPARPASDPSRRLSLPEQQRDKHAQPLHSHIKQPRASPSPSQRRVPVLACLANAHAHGPSTRRHIECHPIRGRWAAKW